MSEFLGLAEEDGAVSCSVAEFVGAWQIAWAVNEAVISPKLGAENPLHVLHQMYQRQQV